MLRSMTGFGRYEVSSGDRKVTVEMKSVNHRYLELGIKLPRKLNFLEGTIRTEMKKYVDRGKVDVFISYENLGEPVSDTIPCWRKNILNVISKSVQN